MVVEYSDILELARLHCRELPRSTVALLGEGIAVRYYRFAVNSQHEIVFVKKQDQHVVGGAVLSLQPKTVLRRFLVGNPMSVSIAAWRSMQGGSPVRRYVASLIWRGPGGDELADRMPEVVQIFVAANVAGNGIGTELISDVVRYLGKNGYEEFYVKTETEANQRAIQFYKKNGFRAVKEDNKGFTYLVRGVEAIENSKCSYDI